MEDISNKKYAMLTFDIEDWFQVENFKEEFPLQIWDKQEIRVENNTYKILDILKKYDIKATFFILGWLAEKKPDLIKKIYKEGHEISSHGYSHQLNYNMSQDELHNDLKRSKLVLEKIIEDKVIGYRAPTFSINEQVISNLHELGYKYDSSLNQYSRHNKYGKLNNTETSYGKANKVLKLDKISEVSLPIVKIFNKEVPFAGGGFFRLYPFWLTEVLIKKHFKNNNYYIFYMHPWELDPKQPKVKKVKLSNKFKHYINIKTNYRKLEMLIKSLKGYNLDFITIKNYLDVIKTYKHEEDEHK